MVSLPIPDDLSPIRYADIRWQEYNLGALVSDLTKGRVPADYLAHLDPDLNPDSLKRHPDWRPILGQTGPAQGHLRNNGVKSGDLFLFFGLFREVDCIAGTWRWKNESSPCHVLWGWLQVAEVVTVDDCDRSKFKWAEYHPHFHRGTEKNNTVYFARRQLKLHGADTKLLPGAGTFASFSERLQFTAPGAATPRLWALPRWFYPRGARYPLTYHERAGRWRRTPGGTELNSVGRGQEFILDADQFPEVAEWVATLLVSQK